ncbi:hypothetical protein LMH87_000279 [Akanthomyces muscarius]|uniref:Uncharacterized protein n=1 Tax=Akanthomyces muscarius TaxID=2231603 RepID=A0A9W8UKZ0_AKAMU|nr:hypothetical protein LMH87_000279 [Akanthomyces muscarius]KAJ4155013.1 hypothetical protein LMH87_000279 [Akanthomyces muscarius]
MRSPRSRAWPSSFWRATPPGQDRHSGEPASKLECLSRPTHASSHSVPTVAPRSYVYQFHRQLGFACANTSDAATLSLFSPPSLDTSVTVAPTNEPPR